MDGPARTVFISYRRDDAAGYAGRLEEALERRLGAGAAFRDVIDIVPGEDFVAAIDARLASARAVLVLIGPRWAGIDPAGARRIDDPRDYVRQEVAAALARGVLVLPVLLQGATMPAEAALPGPLRALARRNAMTLSDTHWEADLDRLVASLGGEPPLRRRWPWAAVGAALVVVALVAAGWLKPWARPEAAPSAATAPMPAAAQTDPDARLIGHWAADVAYDWGARHGERFEFKRHAGVLTGTASFLGRPRGLEQLRFDGTNLHFETHTQESISDRVYDLTHRYSAELHGQPPDEVLAFRMQTSGGFGGSRKPVEFEARRVVAAPTASAAGR